MRNRHIPALVAAGLGLVVLASCSSSSKPMAPGPIEPTPALTNPFDGDQGASPTPGTTAPDSIDPGISIPMDDSNASSATVTPDNSPVPIPTVDVAGTDEPAAAA